MPPKKEEEEEKPLLGRPGNHVKLGIVGLPNVGKSSFFNLMCKMNVPAENRPFCTIDPNLARVPIPVRMCASQSGCCARHTQLPRPTHSCTFINQ